MVAMIKKLLVTFCQDKEKIDMLPKLLPTLKPIF